jgi:hypothetical protein
MVILIHCLAQRGPRVVGSGKHRRRTLWREQELSLIVHELAVHPGSLFLQLAAARACWILVAEKAVAGLVAVLVPRRWLYRHVQR